MARVGKTKYHRLGGLNNRNLISAVLESEKYKFKSQQGSVSVEGSLPAL
jgi:hypothetical protein